jgi:large subunit ribosomal protein L10
MKKDEKTQFIDALAEKLTTSNNFYLADISDLNSEATSRLRRTCFKKNIQLEMVKNTLLKKAMEKSGKDFEPLFDILTGSTSILFSEVANDPAKMIREFRRTAPKPILKAAYVQESFYMGDDQLDNLINIKSKEEMIGVVIGMLQSPLQKVMSGLQSGSNKLSGIVKTLSEKPE